METSYKDNPLLKQTSKKKTTHHLKKMFQSKVLKQVYTYLLQREQKCKTVKIKKKIIHKPHLYVTLKKLK